MAVPVGAWRDDCPRYALIELPNGNLVRRYQIIGTNNHVYEVLVPGARLMGAFSSLYRLDDWPGWLGRYGTQALPPDIDALPIGRERFAACDAWRKRLYDEAYAMIYEAFPALRSLPHRCDMGEVSYYGTTPE